MTIKSFIRQCTTYVFMLIQDIVVQWAEMLGVY